MSQSNIRDGLSPDLLAINSLIAQEQESFLSSDDNKKRTGYFCSYTPPEILNAAGARHIRLFKAGTPEIVSQGERYTQSVFCDFSKGCLGAFDKNDGDPLYLRVERLYNFHTCASMKRVTEVLADEFVPTAMLNLPRLHTEPNSRAFYRDELIHYAKDAAALTGRKITEDSLRQQISLYNKLRRLIRKFSELRKRRNPAISSRDFLELVRGYYYVPAEKLLPLYEDLYKTFAAKPAGGKRGIRLMLAGSEIADGDRKIVELIEDEIGAHVVVEDSCTGIRPFYQDISEDEEPFKALADGYLDQPPCGRMKPIEGPVDFSAKIAQEYDVDGVVYVYLKFCACYGAARQAFINNFQKLGIPVLEISSDYSASDHGQLKTRIEAFVEVLGDHVTDKPGAARQEATIFTLQA